MLSTSLLCEVLVCVRRSSLPPEEVFSILVHLSRPQHGMPPPITLDTWGPLVSPSRKSPESALCLPPLTGLCSSGFSGMGTTCDLLPELVRPRCASPAILPRCVYLWVGVCLCVHAYTHMHVLCSTHFLKV